MAYLQVFLVLASLMLPSSYSYLAPDELINTVPMEIMWRECVGDKAADILQVRLRRAVKECKGQGIVGLDTKTVQTYHDSGGDKRGRSFDVFDGRRSDRRKGRTNNGEETPRAKSGGRRGSDKNRGNDRRFEGEGTRRGRKGDSGYRDDGRVSNNFQSNDQITFREESRREDRRSFGPNGRKPNSDEDDNLGPKGRGFYQDFSNRNGDSGYNDRRSSGDRGRDRGERERGRGKGSRDRYGGRDSRDRERERSGGSNMNRYGGGGSRNRSRGGDRGRGGSRGRGKGSYGNRNRDSFDYQDRDNFDDRDRFDDRNRGYEDRNRDRDRDRDRGGKGSRKGERGGNGSRNGERGGYDNRKGNRGGYDNRDRNRDRDYDDDSFSTGYENGYDDRDTDYYDDEDRGGYSNTDTGSDGGGKNDGGGPKVDNPFSSGGFDFKQGYPQESIPDDIKPVYFTLIPQGFGGYGYNRRKRQQDDYKTFSIQEFANGEARVKSHLSNFSCILDRLNLMQNNGEVKVADLINELDAMEIDSYLKTDLQNGIKECARLTACFPINAEDKFLPRHLQQAIFFFRCNQRRRQIACYKKDIRSYLDDAIPPEKRRTLDKEGAVNRILYIKMEDSFKELHTIL